MCLLVTRSLPIFPRGHSSQSQRKREPRSCRSDAATLRRTTTVVRQRRDVFNRLNRQTSLNERRNRQVATATRSLDANVHFLHTKLLRFIGGLLSSHLTGKRRALTTTLKSARASGSPAKRVALHVGNRHIRVIETNLDVNDSARDVSLDLTFLRNFSHCIISKFFRSRRLAQMNYRKLLF